MGKFRRIRGSRFLKGDRSKFATANACCQCCYVLLGEGPGGQSVFLQLTISGVSSAGCIEIFGAGGNNYSFIVNDPGTNAAFIMPAAAPATGSGTLTGYYASSGSNATCNSSSPNLTHSGIVGVQIGWDCDDTQRPRHFNYNIQLDFAVDFGVLGLLDFVATATGSLSTTDLALGTVNPLTWTLQPIPSGLPTITTCPVVGGFITGTLRG